MLLVMLPLWTSFEWLTRNVSLELHSKYLPSCWYGYCRNCTMIGSNNFVLYAFNSSLFSLTGSSLDESGLYFDNTLPCIIIIIHVWIWGLIVGGCGY